MGSGADLQLHRPVPGGAAVPARKPGHRPSPRRPPDDRHRPELPRIGRAGSGRPRRGPRALRRSTRSCARAGQPARDRRGVECIGAAQPAGWTARCGRTPLRAGRGAGAGAFRPRIRGDRTPRTGDARGRSRRPEARRGAAPRGADHRGGDRLETGGAKRAGSRGGPRRLARGAGSAALACTESPRRRRCAPESGAIPRTRRFCNHGSRSRARLLASLGSSRPKRRAAPFTSSRRSRTCAPGFPPGTEGDRGSRRPSATDCAQLISQGSFVTQKLLLVRWTVSA